MSPPFTHFPIPTKPFGDYSGIINVSDQAGATDTQRFASAIALAQAQYILGNPKQIYIPPGYYTIEGPITPLITIPITFVGGGPSVTKLKLADSFAGDLFPTSDCWYSSDYPDAGPTVISLTNSRIGLTFQGFSVIGNMNSTSQQNVFMFYDHNDRVLMRDIECYYINGRALSLGLPLRDAGSYTRESIFYNLFFSGCGAASNPTVEITSTGSGDSTNELKFYGLSIFNSLAQGLVIRNKNTGKGVGNIEFHGLRTEGSFPSRAGATGDLLQFGDTDASYAGTVNNIRVYGYTGNASVLNYSSIGFYAPSVGAQPYNIRIDGTITSGSGYGITINAGRSLRFIMEDIESTQTNLVVGAAPLVGSNNNFYMNGREYTISQSIDPTSIRALTSTMRAENIDVVPYFISSGGSFIGPNIQVSSSDNFGEGHNLAATGFTTRVTGLRSASLARYGSDSHATGFFSDTSIQGSAQRDMHVMRAIATTAAAVRLCTNDGPADLTNCINLLRNNYTYTCSIQLTATNITDGTKRYSWYMPQALLARATGVGSMTLDLGPPQVLDPGSLAGIGVTAVADTTNGGLDLEFIPPTGNTDTWHVDALLLGPAAF